MNADKRTEPAAERVIRWLLRPNRAAAVVFALAAGVAFLLIWRSEQSRLHIERAKVSTIASDYAHTLKHNVERALSATYSLAALVRQGKGDIADFEMIASEMLPYYPGAASLQLAPDGIVRRIAPLAGNEGAIGHDLLKDPARAKEAFLARDTGTLTLAGPFPLVQGGVGAAGRMPVFLDDGDGRSFWGFAIVLIRFPDVLDPALLAGLERRGYRYALWRINPDTGDRQVVAISASPPVNPIDSALELPNGAWTLSVAPANGWGDPVHRLVKMALGLLICLLLSFLVRSLLSTRAAALQMARKLTRDLKESEQRFRAIFDHTYQFIGLMHVDGTMIEANKSALEFSGVKESEVIGKPFWETPWWAHSREMQEKLATAVKQAAQGEFVRFEATHPAKDGSLHYVDFSLKPVLDDDGAVVLIIPEGRDFTDRKQAEMAQYRLNRHLRALSKCNRILIQAKDEQSLLDDICRIICDEAGYRMAWVGYAGRDEAKTIQPVAWAGYDDGYIGNTKLTWRDDSRYGQGPAGRAIRSGEIVYVQDIATDPGMAPWRDNALSRGYRSVITLPIKDERNDTFGSFLIYSSEINAFSQDERRLLEELTGDLAFGIVAVRTREALRKSEERLRLEVARMPIGYIVWDKDFRVVTWNPAAEGIFGFTCDEAKGLHPYETIVAPEAQAQVDAIWARLLAGDASAHSVNQNRTKDGRSIICEWTNTPLKQPDGTVLGAISMIQDITERSRAEEEIRTLNQELEQRVQERTAELNAMNIELNIEIGERRQAETMLREAKTRVEASNCLLETLSVTDPLTGLANRRRFDEALAREHARHVRSGAELSLVMLDIDHFKAYNDSYGHVSGDVCLQRIAGVIAGCAARASDIAARYGGEEFACILPETDQEGAVVIAEKIRLGIQNLAIPHSASGIADCVTASLGVVTVTCAAGTPAEEIIVLADQKLYKAKRGGRNRVEAETFTSAQRPDAGKSLVQLVWKDIYCSGNRLIDTQHRELFHLANELLDAIQAARPSHVIFAKVERLLENIEQHFLDEEALLASARFPDREAHAKEHARLYARGVELAQTLHTDAPDLGPLFNFLVYEMVFQHMCLADQKFFPFVGEMQDAEAFEC